MRKGSHCRTKEASVTPRYRRFPRANLQVIQRSDGGRYDIVCLLPGLDDEVVRTLGSQLASYSNNSATFPTNYLYQEDSLRYRG